MKKITRKIKFFFNTFIKSLTKFSYYKEIKNAKFSFSLKYLFFLFYVISLIGSIIFASSVSILVIPKVPAFIASVKLKAPTLYPAGLVVNIKNGNLSINQKEPYYIDSLNQFNLTEGHSHFITIDTKANASDIKAINSAILVTKDSVVTVENNALSYKVYPIDPKTNLTIDQSLYNKLLAQLLPYLKYIQPALIAIVVLAILVGPILAASLSLIGQLLYLLIFSLVLFILVKLMKKDLTFKKTYQLSMHASTLSILLAFVVGALGIQMPFMLGSAILFVFMVLVLNQF